MWCQIFSMSSLVADVRILLAHAHHHALVTRATDDGGKDGARGVVTGETGLLCRGEFGEEGRVSGVGRSRRRRALAVEKR